MRALLNYNRTKMAKEDVMPAAPLLCEIIGIDANNLSREENYLVEAELLTRLCDTLKNFFQSQYKEYLRAIKNDKEKEKKMLDTNFISHVISDILRTGDYSLEGIAYYTETTEEVLTDLVAGRNASPSFPLSRKIIELHRTVRPGLYHEMLRKIATEYLPEQ